MAWFCLSHILVTISFSCIVLHVGFAKAAEPLEVFVPDGPVYVRNGDDLTINISYQYSGNGKALITWQRADSTTSLVIREKDGTIVKSDDRATIINDGDLVLNNTTLSDNTTYRVIIQISVSTGVKTLGVIVSEKPVANFTCLSKPLNETKNFSCLCTTSGGSPPPSVVWLKNDKPITSEGFLQQTLTITNASKNDTGNYTCKATSHTLSDKKDITILVKYKPIIESFTINSTSKYVVRGSSVLFTCKVDAYPSANVTLYHNGSEVVDFKNRQYTIRAVNSTYNGNYQCVAENRQGKTKSHVVDVKVADKPKASSNCTNTNNTYNEGDNISCTCGGDNNVPIAEAWWIDNKGSEVKPGSLLNQTLNRDDDGPWTCHVRSHQNLTDEITITIKVIYTDPTTLPTSLSTTVPAVVPSTTKGGTPSTGMSIGAIVGIAVGAVFAVALFIAILWLLCCKKGKEKQSETIVNPSAAAYKPSMMENPYESPDHMMGDGNTADGQDSAGSSRPSTTGANPAPQAGGLPPVYAVVDKSRVTHNKKPEVDPSQVTYASLDAVALQPDSSRMHERPQVESNYASIDLRKL